MLLDEDSKCIHVVTNIFFSLKYFGGLENPKCSLVERVNTQSNEPAEPQC